MTSPDSFNKIIFIDRERSAEKETLESAIGALKKIEEVVQKINSENSLKDSDLDRFLKEGDGIELGGNMVEWEVEKNRSEDLVIRVVLSTERPENKNFVADVLFCLSVGDLKKDPQIGIFVVFEGNEKKWKTHYDQFDIDTNIPAEVKNLILSLGISDAETVISEDRAMGKIEALCKFMQNKIVQNSN